MITGKLIIRLFDPANMQRWNDQIRPVELRELDKQAHKMVIAYVLGRLSEREPNFSWRSIIEGGIFEYLQRLVLTDLKPQLFYRIKHKQKRYDRLNAWVYRQLAPELNPLGKEFTKRFHSHFNKRNAITDVNRQVLNTAHLVATRWEFNIIKRANPNSAEIADIGRELKAQEQAADVRRLLRLLQPEKNYGRFIDLCGTLRFQVRWSHLHREPRTSVLGHMLIVAMLSHLLSLEIGACEKRMVNNYFTGLFHDLPEVLTRDIINPVKMSVPGLRDLIRDEEQKRMQEKVYTLVPAWKRDLKFYTDREFETVVMNNGKRMRTTTDRINRLYNMDQYNARDGDLIKVADNLAAFTEAHLAIQNGIANPTFIAARSALVRQYKHIQLGGIPVGKIFEELQTTTMVP
ncbi:MAG: HD domain-containing protein [Patescibacteria group bacterium]|nr:HD domain-containing protein [Patescibacteria group bacterium]MDD5715179.1 HD domain-containing protein [Patescibacteria group bacterium]